jgi:hypothetical protein
MKYMLLICRDEKVELDPEARARIPAAAEAWAKEMDGRGVRVEGNALAAISASKAVRVRDGQVLITDGPFAETKEQIGGFDILDCADLDEALEVASKHPVATFGTVRGETFLGVVTIRSWKAARLCVS